MKCKQCEKEFKQVKSNHKFCSKPCCDKHCCNTPYGRLRKWFSDLRASAKKRGILFEITFEDIFPKGLESRPEHCALTGVKLAWEVKNRKTSSHSPSLDRIENSIGYVKGNTWIISNRANVMKNAATLPELRDFAKAVLASPILNE